MQKDCDETHPLKLFQHLSFNAHVLEVLPNVIDDIVDDAPVDL